MPRRIKLAAKVTRSVQTPPPTATSSASRSTCAASARSHSVSTERSDLLVSSHGSTTSSVLAADAPIRSANPRPKRAPTVGVVMRSTWRPVTSSSRT